MIYGFRYYWYCSRSCYFPVWRLQKRIRTVSGSALRVIVAVTNGLNANDAFTSLYVGAVEKNAATGVWEIGGVCGMITAIFPTVFLGGLFGKY